MNIVERNATILIIEDSYKSIDKIVITINGTDIRLPVLRKAL